MKPMSKILNPKKSSQFCSIARRTAKRTAPTSTSKGTKTAPSFACKVRSLLLRNLSQSTIAYWIFGTVTIICLIFGVAMFGYGLYMIFENDIDLDKTTTLSGAIVSLISAFFLKPLQGLKKNMNDDSKQLGFYQKCWMVMELINSLENQELKEAQTVKVIDAHLNRNSEETS